MKLPIKNFIFLCLYITFFIMALSFVTEQMPYPSKTKYFQWDHRFYVKMAEDKLNLKNGDCVNPYCYRLVIPAIVSLFPNRVHLQIFKIISYIGIFLTSLAFFYFLRTLNFNHVLSFVGMNFYLFSRFGPKFIMFDNFRPEALSIFFVLGSFIFLLKQKQILFMIFFTLAILTKEQPIVMIFVYYVYHARKMFDPRALKKTFVVGVFPLTIFLFLRIYYPSINSNYPFYHYFFRRIVEEKGFVMLYALISTLGVIFYIVLLQPRNAFKNLLSKKYLLVYLVFQMMILFTAGDDLERFAMYFWPVAIPLALWNIKGNKKLYWKLLPLLIVVQIYISKIYKFYTLDGKPTFINEQHYVNNLAVMMNRDIFANDILKMMIIGFVIFVLSKFFSRNKLLTL